METDSTRGLTPEQIEATAKELEEHAKKSAGITPENLSVRDRLLRRTLTGSLEVTLEDDKGPFQFQIRRYIPDRLLNDMLKTIERSRRLANNGGSTPDEEEFINNKLSRFLAFVCLDKSLDYDFWKSGWGYSTDVVARIVRTLGEAEQKEMNAVESFRPK